MMNIASFLMRPSGHHQTNANTLNLSQVLSSGNAQSKHEKVAANKVPGPLGIINRGPKYPVIGWTIFLVLLAIAISNQVGNSGWIAQAWWLLLGWLTWTYFEYMLHRFVVHGRHKEVVGSHVNRQYCAAQYNRIQRINIMLLFLSMLLFALQEKPVFMVLPGLAMGWVWYCYARVIVAWNGCAKILPGIYRQQQFHFSGGHHLGFGLSTTIWDHLLGTSVPKTFHAREPMTNWKKLSSELVNF